MRSSHRRILSVAVAVLAVVVLAVALVQARSTNETQRTAPATRSTGTEAEAGRSELDPFTTAAQDFSYGETGFAATRDKAQSKLWYHDGSWWAVMVNPYYGEVHVFELRDGTWEDTGTFVDARATSNADVVWTGSTLYVASRTSTGNLLMQRYTYGPGRSWSAVTPSAELITSGGGQSLTIAVDTADRVWATWISQEQVWLSSTRPGGSGWSTPVHPMGDIQVHLDDATAITAVDGGVGVLWSNQEAESFQWVYRSDSDPVDSWSPAEVVLGGVNSADGHINFALSPTGDLYAAVKTSLGDDGESLDSPLIEVLHRDLAGAWTRATAATVSNQMTRAQLVVTTDGQNLVLVASSPQTGGALYYKISRTDQVQFAPGKGTLLLQWAGAEINDATTTAAPIDPAVPFVVLASDSRTGMYYHAELDLGAVLAAVSD